LAYSQIAGVAPTSYVSFTAINATTAVGSCQWFKPMAKSPTVALYSASTGSGNQAYGFIEGTLFNVSAPTVNEKGLAGFNSGGMTAGRMYGFAYTADTGW